MLISEHEWLWLAQAMLKYSIQNNNNIKKKIYDNDSK